MSNHFRWLMWVGALIVVLAAPPRVSAQNPDPFGFRFNSGQGIQPIFEGWAKNADGSYNMYFGYMNRNFVETLEIPVGGDNKIEPGQADRAQPTFFNTRIHRMVFKVAVPKDWGASQLLARMVEVRPVLSTTAQSDGVGHDTAEVREPGWPTPGSAGLAGSGTGAASATGFDQLVPSPVLTWSEPSTRND